MSTDGGSDSKGDAAENNLSHPKPDQGISSRHYSALDKEQRKIKPKPEVLNKYLNLDFPSRRDFLTALPKVERVKKIFEMYPCFRDPNEVS